MALQSYVGACITEGGKKILESRISSLRKRMRQSVEQNGDRNARGCGCSGHSRIEDEVTRQHDTMRVQLEDLSRLAKQATVVQPPLHRSVLDIELVGTLEYRESKTSIRKRIQVHVVGFNETVCDTTPQQLSYQSSLIAPFVGQAVGWKAEVMIGGIRRLVKLTGIHRPSDKRVKKNPPSPH